MNIAISKFNAETIIVNLSGSFDAVGAELIEMEMRQIANSGTNIAVNLSDVTFITSQGVRIILMAAKITNSAAKQLVLVGPNPHIHRVLSVMGVDKLLKIYDDIDALADINHG